MKTYKQTLRKITKDQYKILKEYCLYSAKLYNEALNICNHHFEQTNKYIGYNKLYHEIKNSENYQNLPAQSAQQVLRLVDQNFRSFFALLRKKKLGQYNDKINVPQLKNEEDLFLLQFSFQQAKLKNNILKLTKKLKFKFTHKIDGIIKQVIIKPYNRGQYFKLFIQYRENKKQIDHNLNKNNYLSVDLGINNFASCFSYPSGHSFILNGRPLKSLNRYFNKTKALVQEELESKNNQKWSNQLQNLTEKRNNVVDNFMNQASSFIIKYCIQNKIATIVMGYNKQWKQNSNLGRRNNQKFQSIPFYSFKRKLEYKCLDNNINLQFTEESYTSKCSFIDNEKMKKKDQYLGKRIKRGLYRSSNNLLLNADINSAANILRKARSDVIFDQDLLGLMFNPEMKDCLSN